MSAPTPPALAETIFGDRLPVAVKFADWLAGAGVERGLIGPHEAPRLWDRHVLNCAAVAALIAPASFVVDIGSGAGLPGVVLAIARPDLRIMLVESMIRRTSFLEVVVADLGLPGIEVRRARAEELKKPRLNADVVTARAVAPVDRLAALAAPLLRLGGCLLAIKGAGVTAEMAGGWPSVRRQAMADGATLYAVVEGADGVPEAGRWLPGVGAVAVARWGANALPDDLGAGDADALADPRGIDPLAHVLRLERGAHGVPHPHQTGLG